MDAGGSRTPVEVEVFLDVSCPWCHGALTTIRRLLDEAAADPALPALAVRTRFMRLYELDPPQGYPLAELWGRYGMSPEQGAAAEGELEEYLASVGVLQDTERCTYLYNPILAHRLLAMVRDDAGTDAPDVWSLVRAVCSANFVDGVAIDDPYALRAAVRAAGLSVPERIWARLRDPQDHLAETLADRERALAVSLDGVPRFYVDDTIIPAWHSIDDVRARLRAALLGVPVPA